MFSVLKKQAPSSPHLLWIVLSTLGLWGVLHLELGGAFIAKLQDCYLVEEQCVENMVYMAELGAILVIVSVVLIFVMQKAMRRSLLLRRPVANPSIYLSSIRNVVQAVLFVALGIVSLGVLLFISYRMSGELSGSLHFLQMESLEGGGGSRSDEDLSRILEIWLPHTQLYLLLLSVTALLSGLVQFICLRIVYWERDEEQD